MCPFPPILAVSVGWSSTNLGYLDPEGMNRMIKCLAKFLAKYILFFRRLFIRMKKR